MQGQESGVAGGRMCQKWTMTVIQTSYLQLLPLLPHVCKQERPLPEKSAWLAVAKNPQDFLSDLVSHCA